MSKAHVTRYVHDMGFTFSSGSTASEAVDIREHEYCGFIGSTAFGSTQITFEVSRSSAGTWYPIYGTTGNQISIEVSTSEARAYISSAMQVALRSWGWVRLISGSTGEAAERQWYMIAK